MLALKMCDHRQGRDIVILLLGDTGAGKSSFINAACGADRAEVGKGLEACTTAVQAHRLEHEKLGSILLVDTPGYNQTTKRTNASIMQEVRTFLGVLDKSTACFGAVLVFVPLNEPGQDKMVTVRKTSPKIWTELPDTRVGVVTVAGNDVSAGSVKERGEAVRCKLDNRGGSVVEVVFNFERDSASSILKEVLEKVVPVAELKIIVEALTHYGSKSPATISDRKSSKLARQLEKLLKKIIG